MSSTSGRAYLKQIEVENFKSYNGRCVIGPFDKFTAIIGPNGSGKSNLMDAISFVLGISSQALRSTQLNDLIYRSNTTATTVRRASVMAWYVDTEGVEHTLQRSVGGSGVSEYRLDGTVVSFAAYSNFLEGQNLLIKARNFLVFQGDVESVANKTPKELSKLLEQVAGSDELRTEYERLREEHDRAVEISTFALNRKRTLMNEMKAVQEQKEDVVRYEKLIEEKMTVLTEETLWQLFNTERMAGELHDEIEKLQGDVAAAQAAVQKTEASVTKERKTMAKLQKEVQEEERKLKQLQLSSHTAHNALLEKNIAMLSKKITALHAEMESVEVEGREKTAQVELLKTEIASLEKTAKAFEKEVEQSNKLYSLSDKNAKEYEECKREFLEGSVKERLKLEGIERKRAPILFEIRVVQEKLEELQIRRDRLTKECQVTEEKGVTCRKALDAVLNLLNKTKAENNERTAKARKLELAEEELRAKLKGISRKLSEAQGDQAENERQGRLVEMVESLRRIFPKVHGRLVDLCTPVNKKFEQAAAIVLGKHLESIVVDSEPVALECIRYLKEQKFGQATFLPLDTLIVKVGSQHRPHQSPSVRPALEVLKFSSVHLKAFQFVCSDAVVCDDLGVAREYAFANRCKAVTLDGSVIHKNGLMTGGAVTHAKNNRWEERQLVQMRLEKEALVNELASVLDEAAAMKHVRPQDYSDLEVKAAQLEKDLADAQEHLKDLGTELDFIGTEETAQRQELSTLEKQLGKHSIEAAQGAVDAIEERCFGEFCRRLKIPSIREFELGKSRVLTETSEKRAQFDSVRSKLSTQLDYCSEQVASLKVKLQELQANLSKCNDEMLGLEGQKENLKAQVDKNQTKVKTTQEKLADVKSLLSEATVRVESARTEQKRALQERKNVEHAISVRECQVEKMLADRAELLRKCRLESIHVPLLQGDLAGDAEAILVDYSLLPKSLRNKKDAGLTFAERLKAINGELASLEPNLRAMDKLEGAEMRIGAAIESFEKTRQEAKQARDAFQAIRTQRSQLFAPALKHVMECIDPIYKELTTISGVSGAAGGTAFVSAAGEDAEEAYNDGIRFSAMPPTKRFLDMEHLSGGERTIAALSLLFAIHSYRPAPFFILDEVDAALDAGNVHLLGAFLKRQAVLSGTQFIVISLKGALYERAESLVGVYKQDLSSRVLTLRLSDYPEEQSTATN